MRRAPSPEKPGQGATGPRTILSRLLVALALVLFSAPQSDANGTQAHAGPVAQSKVEQALGILTVQPHVLRTQLPEDASPDMVAPVAETQLRRPFDAAVNAAAPHLPRRAVSLGILPPVRGPPAV